MVEKQNESNRQGISLYHSILQLNKGSQNSLQLQRVARNVVEELEVLSLDKLFAMFTDACFLSGRVLSSGGNLYSTQVNSVNKLKL